MDVKMQNRVKEIPARLLLKAKKQKGIINIGLIYQEN